MFAALRGNGSGDYFAYLTRGEYIDSLYKVFHNTTQMEIGYCMLYYIVNLFGLPRQFVIMGMNYISLSCIAVFIKKYSEDWCLSLLVFLPLYFQFDMQSARSAVAISISSLCLGYAMERKPLKFVIVLLCAMTFHASAMIVLPLYLLVYLKMNLVSGLFLIGLDMLFVKIIGFDWIAVNLLNIAGLKSFSDRYLQYAVVNADEYGYSFSLTDPRLLILIAIFVLAVTLIKKKGKLEAMLVNCCLANILLLVLFSEHTALANRLSVFYNVYLIILIPSIIKNLKERFLVYQSRYIGTINMRLCETGCIAFFALYACVYVYVCFIAYGVDYRLFFC